MTFIWLTPVILSLLILAAHFMRDGNISIVIILLLTMPLLIIKRKWVAWLFKILLVLGALEWLRTTWLLVELRMQHEAPFLRLTLILGTVALVTALSALVFNSEKLKNRYIKKRNI